MSTTSAIEAIWNRESHKYENRACSEADWPYPAYFLPAHDSKILDAGCGAGTHLAMLQNISSRRYGVDLSPEMVLRARALADVRQGSILGLPFENDAFDYCLSVHVITHCGDFQKAIREMVRVVRPGGRVVIEVVNRYSATAICREVAKVLGLYRLGPCEHLTVAKVARALAAGSHVGKVYRYTRAPAIHEKFRALVGRTAFYLDKTLGKLLPFWSESLVIEIVKE